MFAVRRDVDAGQIIERFVREYAAELRQLRGAIEDCPERSDGRTPSRMCSRMPSRMKVSTTRCW